MPGDPDWERTVERAGQVTAALAQRDASRRTALIGTVAAGAEQAYHSAAEADVDSALTSVMERVAPNVDPASIIALPEDSSSGWLSFVRGYLGEARVLSLLEAGNLPAPPDAGAPYLAGDPTQEGWDLGWDDSDLTANIKVAEDADVILRHFQDHPDVAIVYASSDAVGRMPTTDINGEAVTFVRPGDVWPDSDGKVVVDFGQRSTDLDNDVVDFFDASASGASDVVGDLFDMLPLLGLVIVSSRAAYRTIATDDQSRDIARDLGMESANVMVNSGIGELLAFVTGVDLLAAPITVTTGLARAIYRDARFSTQRSISSTRRLRELLASLRVN